MQLLSDQINMKLMNFILKTFLQINFLFICFSAYAQTNKDAASLEKEFTAQTDGWMKAYNSKDAGNLIPFYTEDATYVSGHVNGLQLDGRTNVIANFQNGIDGGGHIDKIEILSFNYSNDLATLLCKYQATNSGVTVSGRNLLVLKKVNGKWLIAVHMTVV